jgi:hypothetical protein
MTITRHNTHLTAAAIALVALSATALATPAALAGPASSGGIGGVQLSPYSGSQFDIGAVVGLRRVQLAQYVVDHALELGRLH